MNLSTYTVTLDMHDRASQVVLSVQKGDTARRLVFILSDGGQPYPIGDRCTATIRAVKPDGTVLFSECAIEDNKIIHTLSLQESAVSGMVNCELELFGADSRTIASPRFAILVADKVYDDSTIESTDEFTALTKAIAETNNLNVDVQQQDEAHTEVSITHKDGTTDTTHIYSPKRVWLNDDGDLIVEWGDGTEFNAGRVRNDVVKLNATTLLGLIQFGTGVYSTLNDIPITLDGKDVTINAGAIVAVTQTEDDKHAYVTANDGLQMYVDYIFDGSDYTAEPHRIAPSADDVMYDEYESVKQVIDDNYSQLDSKIDSAFGDIRSDMQSLEDRLDDGLDQLGTRKQDKLTAGDNITIVDNVISAKGEQPKVFELLNEITVSEDTNSIELTQDDNGNGYQLTDFYISFAWNAAHANGKYLSIYAYFNKNVKNIYGTISERLRAVTGMNTIQIGSKSFAKFTTHHGIGEALISTSSTNIANNLGGQTCLDHAVMNGAFINKILLEYQEVFNAGMKIYVYGVRA